MVPCGLIAFHHVLENIAVFLSYRSDAKTPCMFDDAGRLSERRGASGIV